MNKLNAILSEKTNTPRETLRLSLVFTFLWGLAAHGYMLLSSSISHDSLNEFLATSAVQEWKISLGRIFMPALYFIRGQVSAPWWIGLISITSIGIAVFLAVQIFDIREKWMICLTAGIFTVNLTVTALTATYIHDMDCDMLALLFSVLAVYCWKNYKRGWLYGSVPLMLTLGLYQSYISMTIVLIVICCILWLLEGKSFRTVLTEGLKGIAMLVCGGVLYLCALKCAAIFAGVALSTNSNNSLTRILTLTPIKLLQMMIEAWLITVKRLLVLPSLYPSKLSFLIQLALFGGSVLTVLVRLCGRAIGWPEKILTLVLLAFLPLGANVSHVLSVGISHDLMYYAMWMVYLLALLLTRDLLTWENRGKGKLKVYIRGFSAFLVAAVLWGNVQVANSVYMGKRIVEEANHSLFTRIVYRMEQCEDYLPGTTPVVLIGHPGEEILTQLPEQIRRYDMVQESTADPYVIGAPLSSYYQSYFQNVLLNPAIIAPDDRKEALAQRQDVQQMPAYPAAGSIAMVEDVLVVKLGG